MIRSTKGIKELKGIKEHWWVEKLLRWCDQVTSLRK